MGETITVRLPKDLADWLEETAAATGQSEGRIVRDQLERARREQPDRKFLRLAGTVRGPKNLSSRKGFSRS
jgi:predicted transcriptional regulator